MSKFRVTPIFLLLVIGLCVSVPATFYYLFINSNGGMALAGVLAGIYSALMTVALIGERVIVRRTKASQKMVWLIETILILLLFLAYTFRHRTYYFEVNDNVQWFGIIDDGKTTDRKASWSFPSNKVLRIEKNELLFIAPQEIGTLEPEVKETGNKWNGYSSGEVSFEIEDKEVNIEIYTPSGHRLSNVELQQIESMLKLKLNLK